MWILIILAYFVIGALIFGVIASFSKKYIQWYTVKRETQIVLACLLFWPIMLLLWVIRYLSEAFVGLLTFIKMTFDE